MGWRLALWKTEAKLLGLMLAEALLVTLSLTVLAAEFAVFPAILWGASIVAYCKFVGAAAVALFAAVLWYAAWSAWEDARDEPLRERLEAWPALRNTVREVAQQVGRRAPQTAAFLLSPVVWRQFGCDPGRLRDRGEIAIPASSLAIWPVMSLRCQIGHALVRRCPKGWLFYAARKSITRLTRTRLASAGIRPWPDYGRNVYFEALKMVRPQMLLRMHLSLMGRWNILADLEADARIARVLGAASVATWICQTQLIGLVAPTCLRMMLQPAAERGVLLPIAASCAAFHGCFEPGWLAGVEGERVKAQQSKIPSPFLGPLLVRLAALEGGPGNVHDPRPAATLLPELAALEERLLRHEAGLGQRTLRRAAIAEIGETVLMPMMHEEVERNAASFAGRTLVDLPDLVHDLPALEGEYRPDPRYLPGLRQRQAMIPGLLSAFLAVELERRGWRAGYGIPPGLTLERDGRPVNPQHVIQALIKGDLSREEFLSLVDAGGESPTQAL